jgi:hypothetical protein
MKDILFHYGDSIQLFNKYNVNIFVSEKIRIYYLIFTCDEKLY